MGPQMEELVKIQIQIKAHRRRQKLLILIRVFRVRCRKLHLVRKSWSVLYVTDCLRVRSTTSLISRSPICTKTIWTGWTRKEKVRRVKAKEKVSLALVMNLNQTEWDLAMSLKLNQRGIVLVIEWADETWKRN